MANLFFSLVLCLAAALADPAPHDFPRMLEALRGAPELHSFRSDDGTRLSYSIFRNSAEGGPLGPIVVSEGKGESVYRYLEFAQKMMARGYGPIYVLDHRGQGFSEKVLPESIHVEDFQSYVKDFVKFMDGPVASDLEARGIAQKPFIVAHSMGGTIAELTLKRRPDLAKKIVYVAPMFEINIGPVLERVHNRPVEWVARALRTVGLGELRMGGSITGPPRKLVSTDRARMEAAYAAERAAGIRTPKESIAWIDEALTAGLEVRNSAKAQVPSVIFQGQYDTLVNNSALSDYACKADLCTLVELPGAHALHQERDPVNNTLVDLIDTFFQTGEVPKPGPECEKWYRLILNRPPWLLMGRV